MSVTQHLDSPAAERTQERDILVLWQNPSSRHIYVVGRLRFNGATYSYTPTRGAKLAKDFRGIPGLRGTDKVYRSESLFAAFSQRAMSPQRPDYPQYISQLGLSESTVTPLEQVIHSGGFRMADTIQLLEAPQVSGSHAEIDFLVHGMRHIPGTTRIIDGESVTITTSEHEEALSTLAEDSYLSLGHEPDNDINSDATLVMSRDGVPVGYIPNVLAAGVRAIHESFGENSLALTVKHINGPEAPWHLRLSVHLSVPSEAVSRFETEEWLPVFDEAHER